MTSTASQQNPSAPNSSTPAAPSYASAAGANKKPTSAPLVATGSNQGPPVVVGSSTSTPQNGKAATPAVNGRPNITPAIPTAPAVVRGSVNGASAPHNRTSSVTISANGPSGHIANGGSVGSMKAANIPQFGYESPAVAHSTPQTGNTAPVAVPQVPSPAHSPAPIPQTSGGQRAPSSTQPNVTFGFPGEGDMNKPAIPQNPMAMGQHNRRDSQASGHGDHSGPSRGGYQGGRGGRPGGYNNPQYNGQPMGYPPNNQNFGGNRGGRGGAMYQGGRGGAVYNQSPRHSPAPVHAMPGSGTPNMGSAQPIPPAGQQFYPPPVYSHPQHVNNPHFLPPPEHAAPKNKNKKNNGMRRGSVGQYNNNSPRQASSSYRQASYAGAYPRNRRPTNSLPWALNGDGVCMDYMGSAQPKPNDGYLNSRVDWSSICNGHELPSSYQAHHFPCSIDLAPETGNFDKLLTLSEKQMGGNPYSVPLNQYGQPMYPGQFPTQQQMYGPPPGAQNFHGQFPPAPFTPGQVGGTPMSRNSSQISERPASSTSQTAAPVVAQGTPQQRPAQVAPAVVSGTNFVRQKKSAAIVIKNPNSGEVVDIKQQIKVPASPAPSLQSKTPPVIATTPTPPPKSTTPSLHTRTDSAAASKTAEQLRNEFKDAVQKAKGDEGKEAGDKATAEVKAKEDQQREQEEQRQAELKAAEEAKAAEAKAAEAKAAEAKAAEAKAAEEAKAKEKADAEAKAKDEADAAAAKKEEEAKQAEANSTPAETEEEEMERMIREMEEEDARREKEQAEITAKKRAEAAAAKERAEADRIAAAADNDRKLREQEREMERAEEEKERKRAQGEGKESVADLLAKKIDDLKISEKDSASADSGKATEAPKTSEKSRAKPAALNLAPLNTKPVEPPQPSAALQSLKSARFLSVMGADIYPAGIASPNPALNAAVAKKGKTFKYDAQFLLQFQKVFTEQPSIEFHQQVKSLIGESDPRSAGARTPGPGSGRQGSKGGASSSFPAQGAMGQFGAKALPPGTTSEQRFAMSQGQIQRPNINPMASFGRAGGFPGSSQMSRTPSSTNMGGIPNSPRQGSRSTRGGSKRNDYNAKSEAAAAKAMPLTAGMDLKPISTSATGWKPMSLTRAPTAGAASADGHMDPETVQRKVKAALNKMTPEKFDRIADQILEISSQSKNEQDGRTLRQVIQLTFEKATDEAHWASMYAKFCKRMLDTMSPEIRDETVLDKSNNVVSGGALFRKYLLNRCQEDFERGWKVDLPEPKEGESKETAMLSDEYYVAAAAKRRGLGLIQFIGELYKLGMLTERIMHECVRKLLDFRGIPDEAEIESLTKLLRTIGTNLDSTDKGKAIMDAYFQRIRSIVDFPELPSRLKFMLMDVCDLRSKNWVSKEQNKGPKTLEEVRAEAEAAAAQKAAENARSTSQRGAPGGRPQGGRGDSRNFSYTQQVPNQVGMDELRRLRGASSRPSTQNVSFGPTSMFNSRSNSGRQRLAPGGGFGRAGEESGASSRTGTPPVAHTNAFGLLADAGDNPTSPPSTAASPAMSKVTPDTGSGEKKD